MRRIGVLFGELLQRNSMNNDVGGLCEPASSDFVAARVLDPLVLDRSLV
jgi:hypothetical protein